MAQTVVGLYISTDHVDLVQLSGSFTSPVLDTFSRSQLPHSGIWRSLIQEVGPETRPAAAGTPGAAPPTEETLQQAEESLTSTVRALVDRTRPSNTYVTCAIPPEAVVIRYFQMPWLPPKDRSNAILFEATKYLPYRHEELNRDFLINSLIRMDKTATSPMRITFFAVKKSFLESYLRVLKQAGLTPVAFETVPLSLSRILRQKKSFPPNESHVLVFVDRDSANITIAGTETLYLSRNMTLSGAPGQQGTDPGLLEALLNEARVSMDYYRRRFPGEPPVTKMILTGYQVDEKTAESFSQALGMPVEPIEPIKAIRGSEGMPPGMATPTGLALRTLDPMRGGLNLLPVEERPILQNLFLPAVVESAAAVVVLFILYLLSLQGVASIDKKTAAVQAMIQNVPVAQEIKRQDVAALTALREAKARETRFLESLEKQRFDTLRGITEAAQLVPADGWLNTLLVEENLDKRPEPPLAPLIRETTVKLTGKVYLGEQGQEVEQINHLIDSLRSNDFFRWRLPSITLDMVKRARFLGLDITEFEASCSSASVKKSEGQGA